ncbi:PREDICTED: hemicentin-2-like [Priapulus caudatus]|uniref:Hemicentin-2-like n=1 Tax=Priapulus caudatus TaxID=37621 RepID=A0ABM1ES98_PRICU|nr:PREDICTED: hemicentin-2-like [Priapulus caudatus]
MEITDITGDQTVNAGTDVSMECTVTNLGSSTVSWEKLSIGSRSETLTIGGLVSTEDKRVAIGVRNQDSTTVFRLSMSSVDNEDSGTYRCVTITPFGSVSKTTELSVRGTVGAKITSISDDVTAIPGDIIAMWCIASGLSEGTTVAWERVTSSGVVQLSEGTRRMTSDRRFRILVSVIGEQRSNYTLRLLNVQMRDAGTYRCRMTGTNSESKSLSLFVGRSLSIRALSNDVTVETGETARLVCDVEASVDNEMSVFWQKDGVNISLTTPLLIERATKDDMGIYSCFASDGVNLIVSDVQLIIEFAPNIETELPMRVYFDGGVTDYVVGEVKCVITSNPTPNIEWLGPNGKLISPNSKYRFQVKHRM